MRLFCFSYKQVKHDYSLLRAYAVICGRFNIITVNRDYLHTQNQCKLASVCLQRFLLIFESTIVLSVCFRFATILLMRTLVALLNLCTWCNLGLCVVSLFFEGVWVVLLLWIICVISVFCLSWFGVCSLLPLWSPAGKGLTSWLSFVMLNCVIVTFPCGNLGQVWCLIVLIPDLCPFYYFIVCHCSIF